MLNGLDLFSGVGGLSLALSPWVRPIAYCENDRYAQSVLLSRMFDGRITSAPIWDDITTLLPSMLPRNEIDIIYGGFPCQDISIAGDGKGLDGERSGLFFEVLRLTKEIRPLFVFLENVPAIRTRGLDIVLKELAALGYDCRWTVISAKEVGAPHIRKRWFLLGSNANSIKGRIQSGGSGGKKRKKKILSSSVSDARRTEKPSKRNFEFGVCRTGDGIPNRVERNKAMGNAVVPPQAEAAFEKLIGMKGIT